MCHMERDPLSELIILVADAKRGRPVDWAHVSRTLAAAKAAFAAKQCEVDALETQLDLEL